MQSEAFTLSNAEAGTSAIHSFQEQLAQVRATFLSIQDALEDAQNDPLSLRLHMSSFFSALDSLENHQQRLGEALMQALLNGESAAVAAACLAWDDDDASVHLHADAFSENASIKTSNGNGSIARAQIPPSRLNREANKDDASSRFVTVRADERPQRASSECVLSKIAKPPKISKPIAEIVPPAKAPPVDLSKTDMSKLLANGRGFDDQLHANHRIRTEDCARVMQLIADAGTPPNAFSQLSQAQSLMGSLKKLIEHNHLELYASLPNEWHHAITDYITAYARHMQDGVCGPFRDALAFEKDFETIFRTLTSFSKDTEPGFIYGLKKHSTPNDGNDWYESLHNRRQTLEHLAEEAAVPVIQEASEEELRRSAITDVLRRMHEQGNQNEPANSNAFAELLREAIAWNIDPQHPRLLSAAKDHLELLESQEEFKPIARALQAEAREEAQALADDESTESEKQFTDQWPFKNRTRGKRVAIIGGNRRSDAEEKIRATFGFEEVVWISADPGKHQRQRKFDARLKNGSYDFVIAIQNLVGHAWTDLIFNHSPKNTIPVLSSGYGVQAIGRAIARYADWED